jgi:fructokinase
VPDSPVLAVLGEPGVDLLPVAGADAGPVGTAPRYVARPGGNALDVAVAAGRLGAPGRLLARLGTGPLAARTGIVADTVGAGDPLAAGLLTGLLDVGITSRGAARSAR